MLVVVTLVHRSDGDPRLSELNRLELSRDENKKTPKIKRRVTVGSCDRPV